MARIIHNILVILLSPIRLIIFLYYRLTLLSSRPVLYLKLPDRLSLFESTGLLSRFFSSSKQSASYFGLLFLLRRVREHALTHLIIEIPPGFESAVNFSQVFDLVAELDRIHDAGINIIAHSSGGGLKSLLLLSAAKVRYTNEGVSYITALPHNESFYYADFLKQFGVNIEIYHAGKYKSAGESLSRRNSSAAARENLTTILNQLKTLIIDRFQKTPHLTKKQFTNLKKLLQTQSISSSEDLVNVGFSEQALGIRYFKLGIAGQFLPKEMLNLTEIEKSTPENEQKAADRIVQSIDKIEATFLNPDQFLKRSNRSNYRPLRLRQNPTIAIAVLQGTIVQGKQNDSARPGVINALAWDSIFQQLRESNDQAVILYVDSPGGMSDASERLYQQIKFLNEKKPVYVYFGSVAASGGYYLSCGAGQIFSSPVSLTGSIGVIRMRPQISALLKKLQISSERFVFDDTTDLLSLTSKPNLKSKKLLNESTQSTYNEFIERVAKGRNLKIDEVKKLAEGRVYVANELKDTGLIDNTIDFLALIDDLKQLYGGDKVKFNIRLLPEIEFNLKELISIGLPFSQAKLFSNLVSNSKLSQILSQLSNLKSNLPLFLSPLIFSDFTELSDEEANQSQPLKKDRSYYQI
ncbi:MAG: signal peptide peptidase SppA [Leptonema sp. (in: Bacteria)]|nr:signal peptide peptidase SppA [Leptonema sp. (in: bacteria)]